MDKLNKYLVTGNESVSSLRNLYIEDMRLEEIFIMQTTADKYENDEILSMSSSLAFSGNCCKLITYPKVVFDRKTKGAPILFKILSDETIDKITHRFVKFIKNYPDQSSPISIDLSHNKVVGSSVIEMVRNFAETRIQNIDFRGCIFSYDEVSDDLFGFNYLQELNGSEYSISFNK